MDELTILTRQQPGVAVLENFNELKAWLEQNLQRYTHIVYTEESLRDAKGDKAKLSRLKRALEDKRKEIKKVYMAPYLEIESQIRELTAMIDEPLGQIESFIKQTEQDEKARQRLTIRGFFDEVSAPVGEMADALFNSPAFFESKWENKSTSVKVWQDAIREKVAKAAQGIRTIQAAGGAHTAPLLARFMETLDMEDTLAYRRTLESAAKMTDTAVTEAEDDDRVVGYKVLRINGTRRQMAQLLEQLEMMGLDYEEIEDGMPGELTELTAPDFDSFVAFDIETTGSGGAANGDAPAEITEIGAVKVVNGEIVEKQDWLCNPGRKILPMIARLTGITDSMVADKPPVSEVIRQFAAFAGELPLVGHNIRSSDLHYITKAANRAGVALENPFFDTYLYAKHFKAQNRWESVKLEYLSRQFGIEQSEAHRAWCDAEANVGVFYALKKLGKG
ncbi:MAG: DUF1351 domain-containing protein [Clostridia bacterium]|nr:DUF1351 domain-containing protein [Clostridia bacterium]